MPLTSLECRWFRSGPPPDDVVAWFRHARPWPVAGELGDLGWPEAWRVDRYLALGRADIGVKRRKEGGPGGSGDGLLEFKGRLSDEGLHALGESPGKGSGDEPWEGPVARVDRWSKWSCPASAAPRALVAGFDRSPLHEVRKKRILRVLRIDGGEEVPAGAPDARSGPSLTVELTHVGLREEGPAAGPSSPGPSTHWTLGFEAVPHDVEVERFLARVGGFLEEMPRRSELDEGSARAYPAWLDRRGAGPAR